MFGLSRGANGSLYVLTRRVLGPAQNLELADATAAEAERGMALLAKVG